MGTPKKLPQILGNRHVDIIKPSFQQQGLGIELGRLQALRLTWVEAFDQVLGLEAENSGFRVLGNPKPQGVVFGF